MVVATAFAVFAYYVDSKRPDDDPKKKNYHPLAVLLVPITLPLFIVFSVSIFILRVAAYGLFMLFFIFALIFIRKPFITEGLQKTATGLGDRLMDANTFIVRLFLSPWTDTNGSA
jgi:uncharacterized membrane protein